MTSCPKCGEQLGPRRMIGKGKNASFVYDCSSCDDQISEYALEV